MNLFTKTLFLLLMVCFSTSAWAQSQGPKDVAMRFLEDKQTEWELNDADLHNLAISDYYYGKMEKVHHFYFNQTHQNIKVHNAITSVHITTAGKAICVSNNFVKNLASKVNANSPAIDQVAAVQSVAKHLDVSLENFQFTALERNANTVKFDKGKVSNADINVKLVYQKLGNEVKLAWDVSIDPVGGKDYWSMRVDALDGAILDKNSWTVHCNFDHEDHDHSNCSVTPNKVKHNQVKTNASNTQKSAASSAVSGSYNVFADNINGALVAYESPNHGPRNLITTPHDPVSNPFGWHDTNGQPGAEYTITRGNNCHAYLDLINDNSPGFAPDGGEDLVFDFPWDPDNEPDLQQEAAVTNLFFMTNYIHDLSYAYGFDEESGNFQANNYGNGGAGGDHVLVEAQDGADLMDPANQNNANFQTPGDGGNGRMQMYVWTRAGGRLMNVLAPSSIAGLYQTATAGFGPPLETTPIENTEIALAFDGSTEPTLCCNDIINPGEIAGKIAMIDRGGCFFETKVVEAEQAGAVAAIICNFEDAVTGLGATIDVDDPGIPSVMVSGPDCDLIKTFMSNGPVSVTLALPEDSGPDLFDGDYDNGIIAHEYGHGISNRLTGGPNNAGCLANGEQMGEGWSDFMTLITTTTSANFPEQKRGIGTWVSREATDGNGIRPAPYSTDLAINGLTYDDVPTLAVPHGLGTAWCTMLWDMYWAMVERHGFDDDIIHGTGGNNMAVQLVFTGMKLQGCNPGFVQGRDGILAADEILFDGENQCLIWEAFARRGLGHLADSGDTNSAGDGIADFNPLPTCITELKITKAVTGNGPQRAVVAAGGSANITIQITNHKGESVDNVVVTDILPDGTSASNISNGGTVTGNMVTWNLGTMENLDELVVTYDQDTDIDNPSLSLWKDDLESGDDSWIPLSNPNPSNNLDPNNFSISQNNPFSGENSWYIEALETESIENLLLLEEYTVVGTNPGIRFFHSFFTEAGVDAGYIQISTDAAETWQNLGPELFRNAYPRGIDYGSFVIPFLSGFSGDSEGYIDTWIDLTDFQGETINLRFRFATDDLTPAGSVFDGWYIDDFEYIDYITYNSEACVTSDAGDMACQALPERGIYIEPQEAPNAADDVLDPSLDFSAFPNPANNSLNLMINNIKATNTSLTIVNSAGQVVREMVLDLNFGVQNIPVDVSELASGFYFLRINTEKGIAVEKVMVQHN